MVYPKGFTEDGYPLMPVGLLRNHAALNTSKEEQSMPVLRFAKNQNNSYCSHAIISKSTIDMVIVVIHTFVTDTENTDQLYIIG